MSKGDASKKAAAGAKVKPGKVGEDLSKVDIQNQQPQEEEFKPLPMKEEDAPAPPLPAEEKNDDDDDDDDDSNGDEWDCKAVPPGSQMPCHNQCGNRAVRIWVNNTTNTLSLDCLMREKKDFGDGIEEEWKQAAAAKEQEEPVVKDSDGDVIMKQQEATTAAALATPSTKGQAKQDQAFLTPPPCGVQMKEEDPQVQDLPPVQEAVSQENGEEEEEEEDEDYELIDFIKYDKLKNEPRLCKVCTTAQEEDDTVKPLMACTIWKGTGPKFARWSYCIDCQEADFAGFPTKEDLVKHNALKNLDPSTIHAHVALMKDLCSHMRNPVVPDLASYLPPSAAAAGAGAGGSLSPKTNSNTNFVTPPPKSLASAKSSQVTTGAKGKTKMPKVTPKAVANLQKWQKEAEALGGKGVKIIVDALEAKKKIYHMLYDAFAPMNITDIFKALKGEVPRPLLNAALKDMADTNSSNPFADDSDDEDEGKKSKAKKKGGKGEIEPYGPGSLCFKSGRNSNTELYYVNYAKAKEMDFDERQELLSKLSTIRLEKDNMERMIKSNVANAKQLNSEPTNDELIGILKSTEEEVASLRTEVEESRKLQVNEGTRVGLKKRIQKMAAQWAKRKRMCTSFLANLEEMSEGSISMRKVFSGDCALACDGDDQVAGSAYRAAASDAQKRKQGINPRGIPKKKAKMDPSFDPSAPSLVAVKLGKNAKVERIYFDPEHPDQKLA